MIKYLNARNLPAVALIFGLAITGAACAQVSAVATPQRTSAPQPQKAEAAGLQRVEAAQPGQAKDGFTVKVKFNNPENHKTLLAYSQGEKNVMDMSPVMEDGYQVFRGSVEGIVNASFVVRNPRNAIQSGGGFIPGPRLSFILRNGATVVIEGDADKPYMATVRSEDPETQAYELFRSKNKIWVGRIWTMTKEHFARGLPPEGEISSGGVTKASLEKEQLAWQKEFVRTHPGTYAAIEVFAMYALELSDDEQAAQFAALPATYKNTTLGKTIQSKIDESAVTAVGKPVIPFAQKGDDGKVVDLAALKGKVVLIDFWGSWCVPCRASHPHLKDLYAKYKNKGFEIVAVATENGSKEAQEKAWKEAIKKDGITWLQVLNDPSVTDIPKMYGVVAYPTKILVDRDGVIRGRFTGDGADAFDRMLDELIR